VIKQLIEDTTQLSTVTIAGMEIKICNLHAPNNGKGRSTVLSELKNSLPPHCVIVGDFNLVMDKNRDVWQHPPVTSDYDNSGWAGCQAMARHLGLQSGWVHQHGHDAKPIYTHKALENSTLTTASRIDFILAPNHPQALLNVPCPRCHINFNFGHDIPYWAGKGQADHTATTMSDQLLKLFLFLSAKVSI
jgi:exonuclease III